MRLAELVDTSERIAATPRRLEKTELLAALLARVEPAEVEVAVAWLAGATRQPRLGAGPALVRQAARTPPAAGPTLGLLDVDARLDRIAAAAGRGAPAERLRVARELFARATASEQRFLARLLVGELRQGALAGIMLEAVARAAGVPAAAVRRAAMLGGDPGTAAAAALARGVDGLAAFDLATFRPVEPMLAGTAEGTDQALAALGRAALEHKLDGARIQVHRSGRDVRVFTRRLNEVTEAVPEVVEAALALPVREAVLDGEAIALAPDGRPRPFQVTMRRFGRRLDVERLRGELPLRAFFFDLLRADGETLLDRPGRERFAALAGVAPPGAVVPRIETADPAEAARFLEGALADGHEGVMAKSLDAPYEMGTRGGAWLKVKRARTLDLVVLAAEWGSGRREGFLSNLHLGARDPAGGFAMLGKTFKGMTDEMLAWQTRRLLELETSRDGSAVHVRPELVVEVAFNDVQASPHYPSGMALRFARVKRYRTDKRAADADTLDAVRAIHARGA